jgi:SAM-dependent MidA family methyltransferase
VIDALPVRLFALNEAGLHARVVAVDDKGFFAWREIPADAELTRSVELAIGQRAPSLPRPYRSEVRPMLEPWLAEVTRSMTYGAAWLIDYGYPRARFYSQQRKEGTLRCHYRHRAHDDPLAWPGLQDVTAWVDFDDLKNAAGAAGFTSAPDVTQAHFLIAHGLDTVFSDAHAQARDETARYRLAQEVKRLTLPGQMGESVRVAVLHRQGGAA